MPRTVNAAGVELVKHFEGFHPRAYRCPAGVWTIGYGHTLGVAGGQTVTSAQAESLLLADLSLVAASVSRLVGVPLDENQFAALVSFTFNVGIGNLRKSTLLRRLNAGDYAAVPGELRRWNRAKDANTGLKKALPGLAARREAEAALWGMTPISRPPRPFCL